MSHQGKYHLTKDGLKNLKEEYQGLLKAKKASLTKEAPPFLHSEELNTEFVAFREDIEYLNSRIEELEYVLKNFELIKTPAQEEKNKVHLGAHIVVEANGQQDEFLVVGTLEANPTAGKISEDSPVGRALLGHKIGDKVEISSPIKITYKIKKIKY